MKACNYGRLIIDYVEDNLKTDQRRDFENHLTECPSCAAEIKKVQKLYSLLSEDPVVAPEPIFWREIEDRVKSEAAESNTAISVKPRFAWWKLAPVLVPALAVLGFFIFHRPEPKTVEIPIAVNNLILDVDLDQVMLSRIVDDDLVASMDQAEHYYESNLDEVIVELDSTETDELIQKISEQFVGKI
jgi:anti-sigma-K factor RskA